MPATCHCGRPTDRRLCPHCIGALIADLRALVDGGRDATGTPRPGLLAELDDTTARRHVLGDGVGVRSRNAETPMPFEPRAADIRWTVANTVTTWARDVADRNGRELPATTAAAAASWLALHPTDMARHPAADELADEITHAVDAARAAIDRPPEREFLGPCWDCRADIYALPRASVVDCSCGARIDVGERRAWLLDVVDDRLATAAEISRALPTLVGTAVTASMVRGYAKRGRIVAQGSDTRGSPLYRIGDVITLVTRAPQLATNTHER